MGGDSTVFCILYLAHCFRGKGIFETLEGVAIAQRQLLERGQPLTLRLTVAGDFPSGQERAQFMRRISSPDLADVVIHAGFVEGGEKNRLLCESDCLCFPTYYDLESFGIVVVEAMAAGMGVITTRWRALAEILPQDYEGFVPPRDAQAIAERIPHLFTHDGTPLRSIFLERFTDTCHLTALHKAILLLDLA